MQRYFIQLSFKGTHYHGWQVQPNGISVQEVLEKALSTVLRENTGLVGAGRTDTGVHALFFIAHFDAVDECLDDPDFVYRLNRFLPSDIAIQKIRKAGSDAHARFSALSRTYIYVITRVKDPFLLETSFYFPGFLDVEKMNLAAEFLFHYSDFTSFSRLHTDVKTNLCKISFACWKEENHQLIFTIRADRFLRNMVRAIVGTLLDVGRGKMTIENFRQVIESQDRKFAGPSAPAKGLSLKDIEYPDNFGL